MRSRDVAPLECYQCKKVFFTPKHEIQKVLASRLKNRTNQFCSHSCQRTFINPPKIILCDNCGKEFVKKPCQIKKSINHFCSRSCRALHGNRNKKYGIRESKAEIFLRKLILEKYPNINITYNSRKILSSGLELDIYFPDFQFAIEVNGPLHYFPIYGLSKYEIIRNKDIIKQKECIELGIHLAIVDISKDKKINEYQNTLNVFFNEILIQCLDGRRKGIEPSSN